METNKEKLRQLADDSLTKATFFRNNIMRRDVVINAMIDFYQSATGMMIIQDEKPFKVNKETIAKVVSEVTDIPIEKLKSKGRKREVVSARMIAYNLCLEFIKQDTLKEIGEFFGGRDHSTVIHSRDTFRQTLKLHDEFSQSVVRKYNEAKNILTK